MHSSRIHLFYIFILFGIHIVHAQFESLFDPYENNPRFISKNGHLMIFAARNKNLYFQSYGTGKIKLNGDEFSKTSFDSSNNNENSKDLGKNFDRRWNMIENRFIEKIDQLNGTITKLKTAPSLSKTRKSVRSLMKRFNKLLMLLNKDECSSNPCQHGGTCEDGFNRYICRCTDGYQGLNCEQDIDECARFQGTDLGCQNGGTCLNTFGSFHCLCPANYRGRHCAVLFNDCHNSSNTEICDHGVCIDLPRKENNKPRYRCACFQGWKKSTDAENSACDTDVDECTTGQHKCSRNPPVRCFNLSPGYSCGPCPAGYSGDGFSCIPFDDCLVNNGGCSLSPLVACFSSPSGKGVTCGSCPSGYTGDGRVCTALDGDICSFNNGGCAKNALCRANTAISANYRDCLCPNGFTGNGIGSNGCSRIRDSTYRPARCASDTCKNGGTCVQLTQVTCFCKDGFFGIFCENSNNFCANKPCKNGAECVQQPNGYSCICTNDFTGQNCDESRSACGGELDSEAGVLSYPLSNSSSYGNNITCEWIIRNSRQPGKVLNITFVKFKIEQSSKCAFDFVELYDGPSREFKSVGRFCGDSLPFNKKGFVSTFNSVVVRFKSDVSVAMDGFIIEWLTTEPTCGGMFANITHGKIESPGFPHHYPNSLDCYWKIVADYGKRIQFVFTHLDIESSGNCSYDYLEFREGFRGEGEQIAKFCNWTASEEYSVPPPITSAGSIVRLQFHSDMANHAKGFSLMFHQVPGICGGLLTGAEGIFRPPYMTYVSPSTGKIGLVYQNNVVCDWVIRALPDERISLKFLTFSLEADGNHNNRALYKNLNSTNCLFDFVEVYDGKEPNSPLRARLCGRIRPPEIISSGRYLRVKFRSDLSVSLRGFIAKYTALCGGEFNEKEGTIESPNYPVPTLMSKNCTYLITVPLGYVVRLNITSMDIEYDHRCAFDYLLINNQRYCGKVSPPIIISENNELSITYVNDETRPSRGFQASWDSLEIGCGGVLKQENPPIVISTDRIVDVPISQCLWEIRAKKFFVIRLKFLHPETQSDLLTRISSSGCDFSTNPHIMINDTDGSFINRFCFNKLPPSITSSGPKLFITYVYKNSSSSRPLDSNDWLRDIFARTTIFSATYFFVMDHAVCGRNLFANSGIIRSPMFPRRYPPSRNCTWIIHADNGLQIKLNFTKFELEPESDINGLCYDYLVIRNGRRADSPLIGSYCGNGPLPNIVSHSNYLFLRFVSDSSTQRNGFEVKYETLSQFGCGGTLTSESGSIESPDYPNSYIANLNCEWKIRVSAGSVVRLSFESLSLDFESIEAGCNYDYLELFDGENDDAPLLGKVCNLENELVRSGIVSKTNDLFIRFTSDATISQGGFKLNYYTACNRTIVGRYGVIESPNYPNAHPHNINCTWRVIVPRGNNVSIAFSGLSLESSNDCMFDFLNISQVNRRQQIASDQVHRINSPFFTYNLTNLGLFCGNYSQQLPKPILAKSNEILINFVSDETRSIGGGFRLEWAARGCGAEFINRYNGIILSPNYPNPYPFDTECLWHIRAPDGKRVDLFINTLDLEYSKNCVFDYLEVYGGRDEKAPKLARLCNQISQIHLTSVGNWMTLKLFSDLSAPRRGFNATFSTLESGCGGRYSAERGSIFSPNYGRGNQYDKNTECNYVIQTKGDFLIRLQINDLDIPGTMPNCTEGYLAISDANQTVLQQTNTDDSKWIKLCGTLRDIQNHSIILSKDSTLSLRFKSDGDNAGRGFNATYKRVCGKTIIVDDRDDYRIISSPEYPHMFAAQDEKCRFVLKASKPSERIAIRFTHIQAYNFPVDLNIPSLNGCSISHLDFYEGSQEIDDKRIDHYCSQFIPKPIMSNGDTLLMLSHYTVFQAYVSTAKSFCGGDFFANEGYIVTPGYPLNYPADIECIWMLNAAPGNRFGIEIVDFNLESSEFCNMDYLEIRQHNSNGPLVADRKLCGSQEDIPAVLEFSFVGNVWIKFRSDSVGTSNGFMLRFYNARNVMLTDDNGQIASPGYPNTFHFHNQTFTWSVVTSPGTYIKLDFIDFDLMGSMTNCFTQLSIFNGIIDFEQMDPQRLSEQNYVDSFPVNALPKPKAYYCGNQLPKSFIADGNAVTLTYTANYYSHFQPGKFLLKYSTVNASEVPIYDENYEGVPSNLNDSFKIFVGRKQNFTLTDVNYSSEVYGNSINWYFETIPSMHFNVSVSRLSFLPSTSCWLNNLNLYTWKHWDSKWTMVRNYCNGFYGVTEIPGTSAVRMHLQHIRSNEIDLVRPKYNINFYPVCGGNFSEPQGTISMTDFDDGYASKQCSWSVKVRPGRTIKFIVEYYSIGPESSPCSKEFLQIRNGQFDDSPLLVQPLCGHNTTSITLPETSSNHAFIRVQSTQPNNIFLIHYEQVGLTCGGELVLHSSLHPIQFHSPEYPNSPSHDIVCEWVIRGPMDSGLQINFQQETYTTCNSNISYLQIFNGGSDLSSEIGKYCAPPYNLNTIVIESNVAFVRFVMKERNFRSKFNATVSVDRCHREYYVGTSTRELSLPVEDYSINSGWHGDMFECSIHLRTHPNYYITINVTYANLIGDNCTAGDVIEFHDSPAASFVFQKFCSNTENIVGQSVTSVENQLYITYKKINLLNRSTTQSSNSNRTSTTGFFGIKFRVQTKYKQCQQTIDARLAPFGTIRSPDYPFAVNRRLSCFWRLIGETGTRFLIRFSRFELGHPPPPGVITKKCEKQLAIYPNIYAPKHMVRTYGCQDDLPPDTYSLSNMMMISIYAKELAEREGFSLQYRTVHDNESCSALLDQTHGTVESYQFGNVSSGLIGCAWEVAVGANHSATFVLDTYDVPGDCFNSSLTTTRLSENALYFWSVICITPQNFPQVNGKKYIMPIMAKPDQVRNPLVLLNFNGTGTNHKGLRGEYFIQKCGGVFSDFEGEFVSPNYPNTLPNPTFCHWFFQLSDAESDSITASGYRLIFTEFSLADNCEQEYFTVKPRFEVQSVEKLCARDGMPREIFVGHDLLISFVSSRNLSSTGVEQSPSSGPVVRKFKFRIERVQHGCGGLLVSRWGYFQSPNYANLTDVPPNLFAKNLQYPSNSECIWFVKAIPDFHLEFTFSGRFDIEQSNNCTADYLLFEERRITYVEKKEVESWNFLNRTCGPKTPTPIVSNTNLVRVTFRSNDKIAGDGFRVVYEQKCGGIFEGDNGTIVSPHYSEGIYSNELTCVYKLQRQPQEYIQIEFDDFDLEYHQNCIFDALWIYMGDHQNKSTPKYGPYCGSMLPPKLAASGLLTIVFNSDHFISKRGFKLHFGVTSCGGNITANSGEIVSPPHLKSYSGCFWRIRSPNENSSVALRFVELDLANEHCRNDCCNTVTISEGKSVYDSIQLGYLCSNTHADLAFKSRGNQLLVQLRKGSMENGFEARFKIVFWSTPGPKQGCGGAFIQKDGVIASPDIDGDSMYEPDLDCIWSISAYNSVTQFVELTFERFDVEPGNSTSQCDNDYLDVYDGTTVHSTLLARLCGRDSIPEKIQSASDTLLLHFVTNSAVSGHGFRARFTLKNQTCGGILFPKENPQVITSPEYPTSYPVPSTCQWKLMNSYFYGQPLVLTFYDLDMNCSRGDYVQIASQPYSDMDSLVKRPVTLCSSPGKVKVISNERMLLNFKTFETVHPGGFGYDNINFMQNQTLPSKTKYRGFNLTYHFSLCNETIDGLDNGFILSINYPQEQHIYRDHSCSINITVPEGRRIAIHLNRFQFYHCQYSNLTIFEPSFSSKARATFCDMHASPAPYFSETNSVIVTVKASRMKLEDFQKPDYKRNRILYALNYYSTPILDGPAGCGGNLTGTFGSISSPKYPAPFSDNRTCKWIITSNGYHTLNLTFEFFRLTSGCSENRLEIYDGKEELDDKKITTFCYKDEPKHIVSNSNSLLVKLISSKNNYEAGFLATYRVNTKEPRIRGRVITPETFKFYSYANSFYSLN